MACQKVCKQGRQYYGRYYRQMVVLVFNAIPKFDNLFACNNHYEFPPEFFCPSGHNYNPSFFSCNRHTCLQLIVPSETKSQWLDKIFMFKLLILIGVSKGFWPDKVLSQLFNSLQLIYFNYVGSIIIMALQLHMIATYLLCTGLYTQYTIFPSTWTQKSPFFQRFQLDLCIRSEHEVTEKVTFYAKV